jgi:hypothetical protein
VKRDEFKKEFLSKKEPEVEYLQNSHFFHTAKKEKACSLSLSSPIM